MLLTKAIQQLTPFWSVVGLNPASAATICLVQPPRDLDLDDAVQRHRFVTHDLFRKLKDPVEH